MRLHVVGRGAINSLGTDHATFLDGIFAGRSGVRPLERLAGTDCLTEVCGEVGAEADIQLPRDNADAVDLPLRLASIAAREALDDWGGAPDAGTLLVVASTKADMSGIITATGDGRGSPRRLAGRLASEL
jgi:3-oxoacyl-[acyl-carrier-protein] synthase II